MFNEHDRELLHAIYTAVRPRLSATLYYNYHRRFGGTRMTTLRVGQTANPVFQEWSGPNGTGDKLPPAGPVKYVSSDPTIVSVDENSGVATAVAAPGGAAKATITATDATDGLSASTDINTVEQAVSATLDFVPN
jgi:hypothetical protein